MSRRYKKSLWVLIAAMLAPWLSNGAWADSITKPVVAAKAVELVDGLSGRVLYERHAHQQLPIASVTKLMTLYIAIKAIQDKELSTQELVPVSEDAYHVNGSQIWLEPGERITVDHLLKAIAIGSANDAAYALGEYIGGSSDAFVEDMNDTARILGMRQTHFVDAHGLSPANHYSTAHDLGLLAAQAVRMPLLLRYTSIRQDRTVRNGKGGTLWLINHNRLLGQFPGMDGLKTGYTSRAGYCIVATAKRLNTRLIAVVLGAPSSKARFQDAATLLTWGFQHYRTVALAAKGATAGEVHVRRGGARRVRVVYARDSYLTVARDHKPPERTIHLPTSVQAPVAQGQVLGYLSARQDGREVARVALVAQSGVKRVSWWQGAWHYWWKIAG
jgi:D-alanyl-D-alanine carboxypeptidase (penicillin-binding protein 5/6)